MSSPKPDTIYTTLCHKCCAQKFWATDVFERVHIIDIHWNSLMTFSSQDHMTLRICYTLKYIDDIFITRLYDVDIITRSRDVEDML